jgi:hypothetical protein
VAAERRYGLHPNPRNNSFRMRSKLLSLLIATVSLVAVTTHGNDIEPSKEFYTVPRTANPIVLDGNLNEWSGVPILADPKFFIRNGAEGTPAGKGSGGTNASLFLYERCFVCAGDPTLPDSDYNGPDDHTSAVQIVYDADNVYFGFVVTDEYHENAANSAWNGDSIQLMIANSNRTVQVALYNYALGGTEGALGSVIVEHEAGPGGTTAVVTRDTNTHRTTYEIKLPKESLGLTTLAGAPQFGLGMAINDGDLANPGQGGWGGLGAHAIVFGKTPSETALITLTRGNDIEPGKEFYTASAISNAIVLDGNLSEWGGVPVLADPKFYVKTGSEGTPAGKGTGGVGADLLLYERCFVCAGDPTVPDSDYNGPDDHTSAVQIAYDADNVYFGFVVTDEYHENAANSAWNGDSIQLMIANATRSTEVALYNYALGGTEANLGSTIVEHERPSPPPGITEAVVSRNTNTHRTTYEIKLPKAAVGLTDLAFGAQFGLGMAINDGDLANPGQGGWGGLGAHAIVFGKTPSETALITLGTAGGGNDRLFFSAINPTIDTFKFRVNDRGAAILDASTVRITIDGQTFTPVASPKMLDATDFTFTPSRPFFPNTLHTYSIEATDTLGTRITDSGTFFTPPYAYLAAADAVTPNLEEPGFLWSVHQNEAFTENSISRALHQLAGLLGENLADPTAQGHTFFPAIPGPTVNHPITFQHEEVLNLNQDEGGSAGDFPLDAPMPGLPGATASKDGIAAEITTYIQLPAGRHTLIVNSDDNFRTVAGNINDIFLGQVAGQFDQPAGRAAADTAYDIRVAAAGTYAFKTIYEEGLDAASIEWKSVKEDGTEVLLNDVANGGFQTYRRVTAPLPTGVNMVSPLPNATGVSRNTRLFASIREGASTVGLGTVQLRLDGNLVSTSATRTGDLITISYQPPSPLSPGQHTASLSYNAGGVRTQGWSFSVAAAIHLTLQRSGNDVDLVWTEPGAVLEESTDLVNWTAVLGAASPYRATPDPRAAVFYRLSK